VYVCDEKHMPSAILHPFCRYSRQKKQLMMQLEQSKPATKRMWRDIVVAKIRNQAKCLELCGVDEEYYKKILNMSLLVQSGDPTNVEAQAAALYFRTLFGSSFTRSDENEINAALNYGYAIVRGYIARTLANYGFEPCIGIHHHSELNNFNLADDIIEPFRALVDLYVFQNMPNEVFSSSDKRELCNILNYEMISNGERHSTAYAIERLIHSLERCMGGESDSLIIPHFEELRRHEYE
jgi:CRISPR-associated protein Cas1